MNDAFNPQRRKFVIGTGAALSCLLFGGFSTKSLLAQTIEKTAPKNRAPGRLGQDMLAAECRMMGPFTKNPGVLAGGLVRTQADYAKLIKRAVEAYQGTWATPFIRKRASFEKAAEFFGDFLFGSERFTPSESVRLLGEGLRVRKLSVHLTALLYADFLLSLGAEQKDVGYVDVWTPTDEPSILFRMGSHYYQVGAHWTDPSDFISSKIGPPIVIQYPPHAFTKLDIQREGGNPYFYETGFGNPALFQNADGVLRALQKISLQHLGNYRKNRDSSELEEAFGAAKSAVSRGQLSLSLLSGNSNFRFHYAFSYYVLALIQTYRDPEGAKRSLRESIQQHRKGLKLNAYDYRHSEGIERCEEALRSFEFTEQDMGRYIRKVDSLILEIKGK